MTNELKELIELELAIPFTVADGIGIEKGSILKLDDLMTASGALVGGCAVAGVAASEKIANDGKTKLGLKRRGIFKGTASGAIIAGEAIMIGGLNNVLSSATALSGAQTVGTSFETVADGETFKFDLNIGCLAIS